VTRVSVAIAGIFEKCENTATLIDASKVVGE
jgi:hypothetical protein